MNLLFASCIEHWGGGENWMLGAAVGLHDRGHAVHLAGAEGSELVRRAADAGLDTTSIQYHGDLDLPTSFRFWRLCRRLRADVLCTNMDRVLRVAGPAARLAGVKAVVPRRGSEFALGSRISHRIAWRDVATGIIANSASTRRAMVDSAPWLPPERVRVIYNGIHLDRYDRPGDRAGVRAELGVADEAPVILMVGELTDRKNHALVIGRMRELLARRPDLKVWIAGEGDQHDVLQAEAARQGAADAVALLGFRRDVPRLLAGADLLVHPALMEGFGYVLVEAMASGLPVVASAASNIPEIVADGETGRLCDPDDPDAWAAVLGELVTDPERRARLGAAGRARAHERFGIGRMLDEVEGYFAELAGIV